jgi:hypothetical protein
VEGCAGNSNFIRPTTTLNCFAHSTELRVLVKQRGLEQEEVKYRIFKQEFFPEECAHIQNLPATCFHLGPKSMNIWSPLGNLRYAQGKKPRDMSWFWENGVQNYEITTHFLSNSDQINFIAKNES